VCDGFGSGDVGDGAVFFEGGWGGDFDCEDFGWEEGDCLFELFDPQNQERVE